MNTNALSLPFPLPFSPLSLPLLYLFIFIILAGIEDDNCGCWICVEYERYVHTLTVRPSVLLFSYSSCFTLFFLFRVLSIGLCVCVFSYFELRGSLVCVYFTRHLLLLLLPSLSLNLLPSHLFVSFFLFLFLSPTSSSYIDFPFFSVFPLLLSSSFSHSVFPFST